MRYSMLSQFFMLTVCVALVGAQDQPKGKQQDLFQQYLEKFGPPGPEHKSLEPLVGNWHAKCQIWHDPAQKSAQSGDGTLERKAILGGRFVQEKFEGKILDKSYQGEGTVGFDRAKQKFVTSWIDSMSTALHVSYGTYDESSKTWTFTSEEDCPITKKRVKMRDTLRIVNNDEQHMEMFRQLGDEKEFKTMQIHLTRTK